jgi:hypothetical protein
MGSELAGAAATPMTWLHSESSWSPSSGGNQSQPDPSAARLAGRGPRSVSGRRRGMPGIWPQASGPGPGLAAAWIREQPFTVCLTAT